MSSPDQISLSRILITDDSKLNRMLWTTLFTDWDENLKIDEANDGYEMVELVRANRYDVVVTDIMMPGLSGIDAVQIIREFNPFVPIVGVSGSVSEAELEACEKAGMNVQLKKPIDFARLLQEIGKLLKLDMDIEPGEPEEGPYVRIRKISTSDNHYQQMVENLNSEINGLLESIGNGVNTKHQVHQLVNKMIYVNNHNLIDSAKSIEKSVKEGGDYLADLNQLKHRWQHFESSV